MCRKVRKIGSRKCSPISTLLHVMSTTVLVNHATTAASALDLAPFSAAAAAAPLGESTEPPPPPPPPPPFGDRMAPSAPPRFEIC
jgi:hypothetical protein